MYWARKCLHLPLPGVSEAPGELHREYFRVNSATLRVSKSALDSQEHRYINGAVLTLGTFVVPVT